MKINREAKFKNIQNLNKVWFQAYETSANALSFALLQLAEHKDIQTKLYNEILEVLSETKENSVNFDDLTKLKYMEMVIKESMRLFPSLPVISREVSKDIQIGIFTNFMVLTKLKIH